MPISVKNLSYVYNPGTPFETRALSDITLEIGDGEFIGIIGHTGSGKSTFIQHLNGLILLPSAQKNTSRKSSKRVKSLRLKRFYR